VRLKIIKEKDMTVIDWSNEFCIGIRSVDEQHKELFSLTQLLYSVVKRKEENSVISKIIGELLKSLWQNFSSEEEMLLMNDFPFFEAHRTEHDVLMKKIIKIKDACDGGSVNSTTEILSFLSEWVTIHVMNSDKQFAMFTRAKRTKNNFLIKKQQ
jgi:hemerythrin